MWGHCNGWDRRHLVGGSGDAMCGEKGKPPIDYLKLNLEKCSKCEALIKRKEANENTKSNSI